MITMEEIDQLRDHLRQARAHRKQCGCALCDLMVLGNEEKIEAALREWWAQGCREARPDRLEVLTETIDRLIEDRNRLQVDLDAERKLRASWQRNAEDYLAGWKRETTAAAQHVWGL